MVTTTRINCKTSEAHDDVLRILKENKIKHTYHVIDSWGLYSVVHSLEANTEKLVEHVKDTNIQNHDKNA